MRSQVSGKIGLEYVHALAFVTCLANPKKTGNTMPSQHSLERSFAVTHQIMRHRYCEDANALPVG